MNIPDTSEPDEVLAEALRRDAEMESGHVKPLSEDAFWTKRYLDAKELALHAAVSAAAARDISR